MLFDAGDVLILPNCGLIYETVVIADYRGACSAAYVHIKVNPAVLDSYFLAKLLLSDEFTALCQAKNLAEPECHNSTGRTVAHRMTLNTCHLPEQHYIAEQIAAQINASDRTQQSVQRQLDAINQLPATLLQQAFSGEI